MPESVLADRLRIGVVADRDLVIGEAVKGAEHGCQHGSVDP